MRGLRNLTIGMALAVAATQATAQNLPTKEELARDNNLFLTLARKALKWDVPAEPLKIAGPLYFSAPKFGAWLFATSEWPACFTEPARHAYAVKRLPRSGRRTRSTQSDNQPLARKPSTSRMISRGWVTGRTWAPLIVTSTESGRRLRSNAASRTGAIGSQSPCTTSTRGICGPFCTMFEHDRLEEQRGIPSAGRSIAMGLPMNLLEPLAHQVVGPRPAEIDPAVAVMVGFVDAPHAGDPRHACRGAAGPSKAMPRTRGHVDGDHDGARFARRRIETDEASERMADIDRRCNAATGDRCLDPAPDRVENGLVGEIAGTFRRSASRFSTRAQRRFGEGGRDVNCHFAATCLTQNRHINALSQSRPPKVT